LVEHRRRVLDSFSVSRLERVASGGRDAPLIDAYPRFGTERLELGSDRSQSCGLKLSVDEVPVTGDFISHLGAFASDLDKEPPVRREPGRCRRKLRPYVELPRGQDHDGLIESVYVSKRVHLSARREALPEA